MADGLILNMSLGIYNLCDDSVIWLVRCLRAFVNCLAKEGLYTKAVSERLFTSGDRPGLWIENSLSSSSFDLSKVARRLISVPPLFTRRAAAGKPLRSAQACLELGQHCFW